MTTLSKIFLIAALLFSLAAGKCMLDTRQTKRHAQTTEVEEKTASKPVLIEPKTADVKDIYWEPPTTSQKGPSWTFDLFTSPTIVNNEGQQTATFPWFAKDEETTCCELVSITRKIYPIQFSGYFELPPELAYKNETSRNKFKDEIENELKNGAKSEEELRGKSELPPEEKSQGENESQKIDSYKEEKKLLEENIHEFNDELQVEEKLQKSNELQKEEEPRKEKSREGLKKEDEWPEENIAKEKNESQQNSKQQQNNEASLSNNAHSNSHSKSEEPSNLEESELTKGEPSEKINPQEINPREVNPSINESVNESVYSRLYFMLKDVENRTALQAKLGETITPHQLEILNFEEKGPGGEIVGYPKLTIMDHELGEEVVLTPEKKYYESRFDVVLHSKIDDKEIKISRLGESFTLGEEAYTLQKVDFATQKIILQQTIGKETSTLEISVKRKGAHEK